MWEHKERMVTINANDIFQQLGKRRFNQRHIKQTKKKENMTAKSLKSHQRDKKTSQSLQLGAILQKFINDTRTKMKHGIFINTL